MSASFPAWCGSHGFSSLHRCALRVDAELGAGLHTEVTDWGYQVEAVEELPGQDSALQPGDVIIGIDGIQLLFLNESQLQETFGSHIRHGVEVILVTAAELRDAKEMEDEEMPEEPRDLANYELLHRSKSDTEHEATVRIPVGRATAWQLDEQTAANIQSDLGIVSENFGLMARPLISDKGMESIVLTGLPSAIAKARPEVVNILNFYRGKDQSQNSEAQMSDIREQGSTSAATTAMELPSHVKDVRQFQYHDHTADIIVHSWGSSLAEALAQVCVGMFNYMTPLENVDIVGSVDVHATGHDMLDLLYHLLDEFLYMFSTEMHICRCIEILAFDEQKFSISARGYGEKMDLKKHEQGTEIKAITMHMMKILDPKSMLTEEGRHMRQEEDTAMSEFPYEVYVLLDI